MAVVGWAQEAQPQQPTAPPSPPAPGVKPVPTQPGQIGQPGQPDKRIFGVLPNYRTAQTSSTYVPLTAKQKFYIGYKDSTDYPIFIMSGFIAGISILRDNTPSFGDGLGGAGKYYAAQLADQATGNFLAESVMPVLFHEDPRYFLLSSGSTKHRILYSMSRIFVTKTDSGGSRINTSELVGNAIAVGMSNSYYVDNRNLPDNLTKFGIQIGTDMGSNLLKEFWPDIKRRFFKRKPKPGQP